MLNDYQGLITRTAVKHEFFKYYIYGRIATISLDRHSPFDRQWATNKLE